MLTTGNSIVDAIGKYHFEGNVVPHQWFQHITRDNGKPDLPAIIILSEITYWYRPVYVKDEMTGQLLGMRKRFKADLLQRSYESFAEQFGLTKRQVSEAIKRLEKQGLIKRHLRSVNNNHNVLFIELIPSAVKAITYSQKVTASTSQNAKHDVATPEVSHSNVAPLTFQSEGYDVSMLGVSHSNATPPTLECHTYTEITTENTTKITTENTQREKGDSGQAIKLANLLYEKILQDDPNCKKPNMVQWSKDIRLMLEEDGRSEEQVKVLIEYSQTDTFWKSHITSPAKLRDKATALIRQMQGKQAKNKGRSESIPDWLHQRKTGKPLSLSNETDHDIDFELERQKILAKLGRSEVASGS